MIDISRNNEIENMQTTLKTVMSVANEPSAIISKQDISIARRLQSNSPRGTQNIVHFTRRLAKNEILKKNLGDRENLKHLQVFIDLSRPRTKIINIMRSDDRILSTWTRKGYDNNYLQKRWKNLSNHRIV